ncbi:Herc4, partial [Symbiodinium sp. KB8]
ASGELVCFGYNDDGQCDVPPDLGPVVAVAAGRAHTCAVKTSGELVCFGNNHYGQCDVPPESAAIVAEQEASWIEHNIGSGWHGNDLQSQVHAGLTRIVHMQVSAVHEKLNEVLELSTALQPCRQALQEEGLDWRLQPSGAKIFMEPVCFRAICSHLSTMRLRPCDIFVAHNLEEEVRQVLRQIPRSLGVISRSPRSIAFADSDGEVVPVSRSFLNIPAVTLLNPSSVSQSTTEAYRCELESDAAVRVQA